MFCRNRFVSLATIVGLFAFFSISAFAQGTSITGSVVIKKDSTTPLSGATVTCYNLSDFTESTEKPCPSVKSDGEGKFELTGLTEGGAYILAVSGEAIGPRITLPVKAGEKDQVITVIEGDGKSLTKVEVWNAFAYSEGSGGATTDQKLAQATYEKKLAAATANNEKIIEKTKRIQVALEAGNNAFNSGNYDLAVVKYDEGIQADPDFVGSAPVLYNNKGTAIKKRAVDNYNTEVRSSDEAVKSNSKEKATKELARALDAFSKSFEILKKSGGTEVDKENHKKNILNALDGARDVVRIMAQLEVADPALVESAKTMTYGFLEAESDKTKKAAAQMNFGKYLMYAGDYDNAASELKKALQYSSSDPEVLANLGLSLYTAGAINESKAQKQESLNYFDMFLKVAPKDHKLRGDIEAMVADLTTNEKLKAQKIN